MQIEKQFNDGNRERNEVKRPDDSTFDPVTVLRSVPGCHCWKWQPGAQRSEATGAFGGRISGLTLVELLVTISIMALVIAISLPMVKPMLESNKTKNGADIVAGFLAQARNRAIEEGRPVGVSFERILDYGDGAAYFPYNGASILMRQVAEPKPLSGFVKDVRVAVDCSSGVGQISFRRWNGTGWVGDTSEKQYWIKLVKEGDQIQFDAKGPKYELSGDFEINMTRVANVNLAPPVYSVDQPALFKVFRKPQPGKVAPTMAVPVALPQGIVVDLDSSGMGRHTYDAQTLTLQRGGTNWFYARDDFCAVNENDRSAVTIMFSSTGEVDRVYYNDKQFGVRSDDFDFGASGVVPSGPIFLCIGIWERAGFWEGGSLSDVYLPDDADKTRNYHDMNNYWVTVFPRTGAVRVNRVAYISPSVRYTDRVFNENESRKFANSMHGQETR